MRKVYVMTYALVTISGIAGALLWSVGIAPALHLDMYRLAVSDICAGWVSGTISYKVFEARLDSIDRANTYIREMQAIAQRDRERARA